MRKLLALLLLSWPAWGQVSTSSLLVRDVHRPNLVSEWRADEGSGDTLNDYRSSNDGQLGSSAGADANDPDWVAAGLDFPTDGDRVEISGLTFDPNTGTFSLSFVAEYDDNGTPRSMYSQEDGTGTGRDWININGGGTPDNELCTFLAGGQKCVSGTVSAGWHHFTITWNNSGTIVLYLDGDGGQSLTSLTMESATGAHRIGCNKFGTQSWGGSIAWGLYYSDVLTATENNINCRVLADRLRRSSRGGIAISCN